MTLALGTSSPLVSVALTADGRIRGLSFDRQKPQSREVQSCS